MDYNVGYKLMTASYNANNNLESLYDKAGFFSRYAFYYMVPLFSRAFKKDIDMDDVGPPPREDQSKRLGIRLQQAWQQEILTKDKPSFTRALIAVFGFKLFRLGLWDFVSKCIAYPMQAVALGWLIRSIGEYIAETDNQTLMTATTATTIANNVTTMIGAVAVDETAATNIDVAGAPVLVQGVVGAAAAADLAFNKLFNDILLYSMLMILFTALAVTTSHPFFFGCYHLGMKCRIASCYVIYKKSLKLSQSAMSQTTVGQMVNLLSNDVNRFDQAITMIPYLVMAPLQALVMLALLASYYLGIYPTLAALATILLYVALQTSMGGWFGKLRQKTARRTDERVRLMNEIVSSIRVIKMYCWEKSFEKLVTQAREREINCIAKTAALRTINTTLFFVSSKIIVFVALVTYISLGYTFTPENVFVSIALSNLVRVSLTLFFPNAVAQTAETLVSCKRIRDFLLLPEIDRSPVARRASNDSVGCKYVVELTRVTASWESNIQNQQQSKVINDSNGKNDYYTNLCPAVLRGLSFAIKRRDLVLIVGRVGSGKSSVLMSMLGELPIASGRLEINGRLSYASQEPWIFSGTVRDNILFGKDYHAVRYKEVLRVCNLDRDMELFPEADMSIVGERGVSLSGGQKARVNLARALYNDADIYLLDDPLSAVDASVAKHIFNNCLKTFLKKKTVILATHQLQFLSYATKVLVVDSGLPAAFGTLQEVMASKAFEEVNYSREAFEDATTTGTEGQNDDSDAMSKLTRLRSSSHLERLLNLKSTKSSDQPTLNDGIQAKESTLVDDDNTDRSRHQSSSSSSSSSAASTSSPDSKSNHEQTNNDGEVKQITTPLRSSPGQTLLSSNIKLSVTPPLIKRKKSRLESDEVVDEPKQQQYKTNYGASSSQREGGEKLSKISADMSTYLYYLANASGFIFFTWYIVTNLTTQALFHSTDFWLSFWTDSEQRQEAEGAQFTPTTIVDNLTLNEITLIYAGLVTSVFVASFLRTGTHYLGCLRASINMHNNLFHSILKAPMIFFDFSPIGILLNRISRDTGFVDDQLPTTAMEIITIFVNVFGIIIVTMIINYWNLIPAVILLAIAFSLRHYSARTVRRLKQIEGVARSPIFSHLANTLSGISTIRAFTVQDDFLKQFDDYQDTHTSAWFLYISSGRWLTIAMDWLCLLFISTLISVVILGQFDNTNASIIGLLVSQAVMLPGPFQWGMRQLTELESQMTSVQRIKEYSELASEHDDNTDKSNSLMVSATSNTSPRQKFTPTEGEIMFCGVTLNYFKEEEPVLKNLNFHIRPNEKVGIVGRTGAGKSSIMAVLFRLYDYDGAVLIDSVDSKSIPLSELRPCISIIPQDPILFSGSIRKNLDPFNEFSDFDLWRALKAVRLDNVFSNYNQKLDFIINEGGSNFSIGQRQLICLARAIARRNKILVLDEATANVDPETDIFIQRTIREQFAECTVLTIAHRLITVMDSDRVMVLDAGQVKEFDEPYKLLQNENGLLTKMTDNSGQQADRLYRIAKASHLEKLKQTENKSSSEKEDNSLI